MTDDKKHCVVEDKEEGDKLVKCWSKLSRDVASGVLRSS